MPIFMLGPVLPPARKWEHYRKLSRMVVRAPDEAAARRVAAAHAPLAGRDEGMLRLLPSEDDDPLANPWLDPELATCEPIDADGPPEVLAAEGN